MDIFEDSSGAPVYLVTDNEHGSAIDSDAFTSETSSCRTMSTLASEEVAAYFQTIHGFQYVADDNLPNLFPSDSNHIRADVLENAMFKLFQGGTSVPAAAHDFLLRGGLDGRGARVLDLVTNSGVWVHEMAGVYPTIEIVSLDLRPLTAFVPHPRNTFEVYDLYAGIAEPDASFDLVHARQCIMLMKDYNFLLREMHRVLKPGGMLIIEELPFQNFEVDNPSIALYSSPHRAEAMRILRDAQTSQGIDIAAYDQLSSRLDPGHPMWGNQALGDATKQSQSTVRGFHTITPHTHLIPSRPWSSDQNQHGIGVLSQAILECVWVGLFPVMLNMGYSKTDAGAFVGRLFEETKDPKLRFYGKYKVWCARKI